MPISVTFTRPKTNNIVARKNISKKTHESGSSTNKSNNKKKMVIVVCLYMHIVCLLPRLLSVGRKNKPGFSLGSPMGACWICCGSFRPKPAEAIWSSCMWIPRSWVAPVWSSPSEPMDFIHFHTLELSRLPPVHAWGPQVQNSCLPDMVWFQPVRNCWFMTLPTACVPVGPLRCSVFYGSGRPSTEGSLRSSKGHNLRSSKVLDAKTKEPFRAANLFLKICPGRFAWWGATREEMACCLVAFAVFFEHFLHKDNWFIISLLLKDIADHSRYK